MAAAAHIVPCRIPTGEKFQEVTSRSELIPGTAWTVMVPSLKGTESEGGTGMTGKTIVLQPRVCNLRSYGSEPVGVLKRRKEGGNVGVSSFFEIFSEYINSSKKNRILRLSPAGWRWLIVFAATVGTEVVTGNSLFQEMDVQGIVEATGACLGAVAYVAAFAWFSSARSKVGGIFTNGCNMRIDSLIDQIVDAFFYESELSDLSDEI